MKSLNDMRLHWRMFIACAPLRTMVMLTVIVIGFVMAVKAINNIHSAGQIAIAPTTAEHIVHSLPDHDCVLLASLVMYWLWRSAMIESAESVFLCEDGLSVSEFLDYFCFCVLEPPTKRYHLKARIKFYMSSKIILLRNIF